MSEVTITINGRSYDISCETGQEGRIIDLAAYVDQCLQQISKSGAAYNDSHLLVLTSLVVADELFKAKDGEVEVASSGANKSTEEDPALLSVIEHLTERVSSIAHKVEAS